ncbi:CoA transferase [Roseomonas sp. BN140053]|uniref:CoA transferase n=1 Tax=Roseomonas sp. BN140053 TaxID=3391898 RepID=UPI0039ED22D9
MLETATADPAEIARSLPQASVIVNDLGRGVPIPAIVDDVLKQRSGSVISCAIVSFPEEGPQDLPELEDGPVLAVLGINRMATDEPRPEPLHMPSLYAAQMAALQIGGALLQRLRGDTAPQAIEVSLFGAALNALGRQLVTFDDPRFRDPLSHGYRFPVAQPRLCADGRYVQPHGMFPHFIGLLMEAGGHPEWAAEASAALHHLPDEAAVALWNDRMDAMFLQRDAAEWERAINAIGGACTMCRTRSEWAREPHAAAAGVIVGDGGIGPGVVVRSGEPAAAARPSATDTDARRSDNRPLAGTRVVDFCIIIAGPTAGRVLADLGAEVVKIDAPNRYVNPCLWMDVNRGKRSIVLDLRRAEGREIAAKFVAQADVVLENFRTGKLEQLGLGYAEAARLRPGIIYASTNAMDPLGPWSSRPGWEHNAQAATGMQLARGTGVPQHVPFPVNDYATGMFAALGVVWAMLHRERTGAGSRVFGSLARSATYVQRFDAHDLTAAPEGRTLRCADGWITLWRAGEFGGGDFEGSSCEDALARVAAAGGVAVRENVPTDLRSLPWVHESGLMVRWRHGTLGGFSQGVPQARSSAWQASPNHPAPEPGADADALLAEIGMADVAPRLRDQGVVSTFPLFGDAGR